MVNQSPSFVLLKGNHNTFYLSSKILESLHNPHVQQYNAKMFDDYFKETSTSAESLTCLKSYEQIFTNYIKMHRKNTRSHLYLFIDFCQFQYINAAVLNTMLNLLVESWGNVSVIAALSSGEGLFGDNEQFREDITNFIDRFGGNEIEVTGFTEEEARIYLKENNYQVDFDDIRDYSGTNPLLLSKWSCQNKVHRVVKQFIEHNLKVQTHNPVSAVNH